jgi:hypothetical protein
MIYFDYFASSSPLSSARDKEVPVSLAGQNQPVKQ